jgi:RimJ/RimL family protein N-acetyltransferase
MDQLKLRRVVETDLPIFFLHQADQRAARIADFPSREEAAFYAHWHKIMADPANILRTVLWEGQVAGNMVSFIMEGKREVGYWLGREYWGKGIASAALKLFLQEVVERPLYGVTAKTNPSSARVLVKCGFELLESSEKETIYCLK